MYFMTKNFIKKMISFLIKNEHYYIIAIIYRFFIFERLENGRNSIIHSSGRNCITIFALDADRYRGDLEVLASSPLLRVLYIRNKWQGALINRLYNKDEISILKYDTALPGDYIYDEIKKPAQEFMCEFLKILFSIIKVDCVTNVNYRYREDTDWTFVSEKIGIPYIMLYRECMLQKETRSYPDAIARHRLFKFHGSHIIVHNDICKSAFIDSQYCDEKKISAVGALRMDNYLKSIKGNLRHIKRKRKKFILFYFPYDMSVFGKPGRCPVEYKYKYVYSVWPERKNFFREIHSAVVELAIEHPDIDFVIRPKGLSMKGASWKFYKQVLDEIGLDMNEVDNYSVDASSDTHELILNSDVFCAFHSSTAIEAAISGKPVILPVFESFRSIENYQDFQWKKHIEVFNVANNKNHFKSLIISLIKSPLVSSEVLNERKKIFKTYFNNIDGTSLNGCVDVIKGVVEDSKGHNCKNI